MTKILITGCTGTLGKSVTRKLLQESDSFIVGISRDEQKQRKLPKHARFLPVLCDIRDERRLLEVSRDVNTIFHFAALKCVDTLEENPEESIATNVIGTENVLHAQRIHKISRVVLSSTDKACLPINTYGACKMLSEKLVLRNPNNVVVRYGNVLGSRGSVIPMFIKSIQDEGRINITHPSMTRFYLRIQDASQFIIASSKDPQGGLKIYKQMKAVRMLDLARAIGEILGCPRPKINAIGMRAGEKIHENLIHEYEGNPLCSSSASQYSRDELLEILKPIVDKITGARELEEAHAQDQITDVLVKFQGAEN